MRETEALLRLMGLALNGRVPEPEELAAMDQPAVLELARAHGVGSLAASAAIAVQGADEAWRRAYDGACYRQALMGVERESVCAGLAGLGVDYVPLKGIVVAGLYPDPATREMADNDLLFRCPDAAMRRAVRGLMEGLGYEVDCFEQGNEDVYLKPPVCNMELHVGLFPDYTSRRAAEGFADVWDRVVPAGGRGRGGDVRAGGREWELTPTDQYVLVVAHMHKHFSQGGCGLRTLADLYVLDCLPGQYQDAIDHGRATSELARMGAAGFESDMRSLAERLLSPGADVAAALAALTGREAANLRYLLESGTYGTERHFYANAQKRAGGGTEQGRRARYLLSRLFPAPGLVLSQHAVIDRHRWLLPLFYPYRILRGAVAKREKIARELRYVLRPGD